MLPNFNYGQISDEQKSVAVEIIELAKQSGNNELAELIKYKFQIVEPNKFDITNSAFVQACEAAGFKYWIQGWLIEDPDNLASMQYPIISITEDVRKLDKFIESMYKS
jgi:hypothetical protein